MLSSDHSAKRNSLFQQSFNQLPNVNGANEGETHFGTLVSSKSFAFIVFVVNSLMDKIEWCLGLTYSSLAFAVSTLWPIERIPYNMAVPVISRADSFTAHNDQCQCHLRNSFTSFLGVDDFHAQIVHRPCR